MDFSCTYQLTINSAISIYVFCRISNRSVEEKKEGWREMETPRIKARQKK
jgi:hypothetical protein